MKSATFRWILLALLSVFSYTIVGQNANTPYDNFPGIIASYKPAYDSSFPHWAKMLYEYPVNFQELTNEYKGYNSKNPHESSPIVRYYKMWSRAVAPYVLADGSIHDPDLIACQAKLKKAQREVKNNTRDDANWTFLGPKETYLLNEAGSPNTPLPTPTQVNIYAFDVAKSNHNILYAGSETGYLNKTTDEGLTWQLLAPYYPFGGGITAVAIHPVNSEIIYVGAGNEVHKSMDGGLTWSPMLPAGMNFNADKLTIDTFNPQKILSASSNGIHLSIDGGESWTEKWYLPSWDVEIKPDDHNIIYALSKSNGKFTLVISTDGGQNFIQEPSFPANITESSGGLLAVTEANPDLLFVILLSADNTPYLYKGSFANGNWTWSLIATGQTSSFGMNNGQGFFDLALEVSPTNANHILVGTTTLYKSLNGGNSFTAVGGYTGAFNIHPDIQAIKMLSNGKTWVATDGGMNLTTDMFTAQTNHFIRVNGLVGSDMWGFDQGWNEDLVVGGRYHNGNTAIADFYQPKALRMGGAESPTGWVVQGRSRHAAFNDLGNGWILPSTAEGQPEGRFIFSKYPNMDEYGGRRGNIVTHPNYYGTFYLGENQGFWKSTDMGTTYDLLYTFPNKVRYLQISYSNHLVLYADVVNYGLYKTEDGGLTWDSKPSLCSSPYGNANWKGKLFFAISPFDENRLYACLQNGTWSSDIGKVFMSEDGGDTWDDWTGTVSDYTKNLCIQPSDNQDEIVYLFTTSRGGSLAHVYYRTPLMDDWATFETGYPAGMSVNLAMPFFRDGKIRVAGDAGVWESDLLEPEYEPIVNPWVERNQFNCMLDTLYFDDHSIMNHEGASWFWSITPDPQYIEDAQMRNPKVVLGSPVSYTISLTINKNGQSYSKTLPDLISTTTCPSIDDCSNPAEIPKENWQLLYVDSEEVNYPGLATMSFDGDPETIWHTRWSTGNDPYPHEIQVDMGEAFRVYSFTYLTRQDGQNGRIKDFELYLCEDELNWGTPVATGSFENTAAPQNIEFPEGIIGRYWRLVALSEVNGNAWASAAEFSFVGCTDITFDLADHTNIKAKAFPVPGNGLVNISLPTAGSYTYHVYDVHGQTCVNGRFVHESENHVIDIKQFKPGVYFIKLRSETGVYYKLKVIKE